MSLLENTDDDLSGEAIGLFSYGSGAVAEFFSTEVQRGYEDHLHRSYHRDLISERSALSYEQYLELWHVPDPDDGSEVLMSNTAAASARGRFQLTGISDHKRCYEVFDTRR